MSTDFRLRKSAFILPKSVIARFWTPPVKLLVHFVPRKSAFKELLTQSAGHAWIACAARSAYPEDAGDLEWEVKGSLVETLSSATPATESCR